MMPRDLWLCMKLCQGLRLPSPGNSGPTSRLAPRCLIAAVNHALFVAPNGATQLQTPALFFAANL